MIKMFELFDNPVSWKVETEKDNLFSASFTINNILFSFNAELKGREWEVSFGIQSDIDNADFNKAFMITGTGNQFTVFATVADILLSFIGDYEPKRFWFSAEEDSRIRLYTHFTINLVKQIPYDYRMIGGIFEFKRVE